MKVGITELVIPRDWGFDKVLATIKADGYEALELALRDEGYCSLAASEADLKKLPKMAARAGIELVSICPAFRSRPKDVMTNDTAVRRASIETLRECMRIARAVEVDTILLTLGALTPDLFYDQAYANSVETLRKVAPIAEDMGVKLAVEYVWNKFLLSPVEFRRFLDDVGSPNVGFYFDPGNMCAFSYPHQWVRIVGKHLMAVHMKDFKRQGFQWVPLGQGDADFPRIMAELRALKFDGALVSEVDTGTASYADTAKAIGQIMKM
jgi:L-ribulose-5-phosphate 3-epimerase